VRAASRSSAHSFDWYDPSTWAPVLSGVGAVYLVPPIDPDAAGAVTSFVERAAASGVTRLVLLSGRGVGSPGRDGATYAFSLAIEDAVRAAVPWTILRPSWFAQNFSEDFLLPEVLAGEVRVPTGDGAEPFIHVDDIAEVAAAVLTEDGHSGRAYDLSGPRTLTFAQAAAEIGSAAGHEIRFVDVPPEQYVAELLEHGLPPSIAQTFGDLFAVIRKGLSDSVSDGVQQVLGRPPRDFADYTRQAASTGVWSPVAVS
jgi:uncharacterized protein YbjT (DUF2867 family)